MKRRIIGIDIDGVITYEGEPYDNIWHNSLCNYLGRNIKRVKDSYDFVEAYGLPCQVIEDFLKENIERIYSEVKPASGAREALQELQDRGFTLYLITARNSKFRPLTEEWLKKHKIPYTRLFHDDNKAPLAIKNGVELFIEDNEMNTRQLLAHNIPVILFNKYHNSSLDSHEQVYRVDNWQESKKYIYREFELNKSENAS